MKASECRNLLGVSEEASAGELKKAYRRLAQKWHPDRHAGSKKAEEKFKAIKLAYETLRDPKKRTLAEQSDKSESFVHAAGAAVSKAVEAARGWTESSSAGKRGEDVRVGFDVGFSEALLGAKRTAQYWRAIPCLVCEGSGGVIPCSRCGGHGRTRGGLFSVSCRHCGGGGTIRVSSCVSCGGTGQVREEKTLILTIPPGADDGMVLRVRKAGHWPPGAGVPGDFLAAIAVEVDPFYSREGADLRRSLFVDVLDAALGKRFSLKHPDGREVSVEVPAGARQGQEILLPGLGCRTRGGAGSGDLICEIELVMPDNWSSEDVQALSRLRADRDRRG